jgi:UPF0755 protein
MMTDSSSQSSNVSWFTRLGFYLVLFSLSFTMVWVSRYTRISNPEALVNRDARDTVLFVYQNEPIEAAIASLDSVGYTFKADELLWVADMFGYRSLRPGRYVLTKGLSYREVLAKLARGQQDPIRLTIYPGKFEQEVIADLDNAFMFTKSEFLDAVNSPSFLDSLGISRADLIAYLHPDTYEFYWTMSPRGLIQRLKSELENKISEEIQNEIKFRDLSFSQVLTMASIVQGEAIFSDEMPRISGLYWNRVRIGMPLQADPTVGYALGAKRRLFYADYAVEHPYNTYKNRGLPPGPINNPTIKAIEAAVFPERHEYIYMVATPEGRHVFSKDYSNHQRAARQWRNYLNNR